MFDSLSDKLERAFKVLKGQGKISEINVSETVKEIRKALLDADVNYKVAKQFTDTVKEKALGQNVLTAISPGQLMVKITQQELTNLMGGETTEIKLTGSPTIILMSGLQGSGKTTFSGKLANFPEKVVLPEPCKPLIKITVGLPVSLMSVLSPPINAANSSCVILVIN